MKTEWPKIQKQVEIQRELPKLQPNFLMFECIYGPHKADVMHKGTSYCREHYAERARIGELIN